MLAKEERIFLYHIWEYEWNDARRRDIIISQIRNILRMNESRIFARKCELRSISFKEIESFLNDNHIQGSCASKINLGLYHQNELVSLMTFGKPRFDKSCEYELLRFCNKKNTSVIGGASKLFNYFVKNYNPKSILSYSHLDKGRGNLYENLGFTLKRTTDPGYVWTNGKEVLSRYQCQKHKLLKQGFEGNSEKEIMEGRNFHRIMDCGNTVWVWTL